jgi:hypothetical protein
LHRGALDLLHEPLLPATSFPLIRGLSCPTSSWPSTAASYDELASPLRCPTCSCRMRPWPIRQGEDLLTAGDLHPVAVSRLGAPTSSHSWRMPPLISLLCVLSPPLLFSTSPSAREETWESMTADACAESAERLEWLWASQREETEAAGTDRGSLAWSSLEAVASWRRRPSKVSRCTCRSPRWPQAVGAATGTGIDQDTR